MLKILYSVDLLQLTVNYQCMTSKKAAANCYLVEKVVVKREVECSFYCKRKGGMR